MIATSFFSKIQGGPLINTFSCLKNQGVSEFVPTFLEMVEGKEKCHPVFKRH